MVERPGRCLASARQPSRASVLYAPCTGQADEGVARPLDHVELRWEDVLGAPVWWLAQHILVSQLPFSRTLRGLHPLGRGTRLSGADAPVSSAGISGFLQGFNEPRRSAFCVAAGDPTSRAAAVFRPPVVAAPSSVLEGVPCGLAPRSVLGGPYRSTVGSCTGGKKGGERIPAGLQSAGGR